MKAAREEFANFVSLLSNRLSAVHDFLKYMQCLLQLTLYPSKGWEDVSQAGTDRRSLLYRGLFPLLFVVAMSTFARLLYTMSTLTFTSACILAVMTFVAYFVSLPIALFIFQMRLPDFIEGSYNDYRTSTFINYSLGLLAITTLIGNLLPFDIGINNFLPIYVALIQWKGSRFMAVRKDAVPRFMLMAVLSLIALPLFIRYVFTMIL